MFAPSRKESKMLHGKASHKGKTMAQVKKMEGKGRGKVAGSGAIALSKKAANKGYAKGMAKKAASKGYAKRGAMTTTNSGYQKGMAKKLVKRPVG